MKKQLLLLGLVFGLGASANAQWAVQNSNFAAAQRGIYDFDAVDANTVWAIGYDGTAAGTSVREFTRTTNGGANWNSGVITVPGIPATYEGSNISAISADTAVIALFPSASAGGALVKTTDGGATWTRVAPTAFGRPDSFLNFVHFFNSNEGIAQGDPADEPGNPAKYFEIWRTADGGTTWTRIPSANIPASIPPDEYGTVNVFDAEGDNIWFGTTKGRVYTSVDRGQNWVVSTTGLTNVFDIDFRDDMNGLTKQNGDVYSTNDGGLTWNVVNYSGNYFGYGFGDLESIPGTDIYVVSGTQVPTGPTLADRGTAFSTDDGMTWTTLADSIQVTALEFADSTAGWGGGFNGTAPNQGVGGIFSFTGFPSLAVNNNALAQALMVAPNPSNGEVMVSLTEAQGMISVSAFDALGRQVYSSTNLASGTFRKQVNLSHLPKGIYLLQVKQGEQTAQYKLVLQ